MRCRSRRPLGPAGAVTSASIIACRPPTAALVHVSAILAIATLTRSEIAGTVWFWLFFFTAVPLLSEFLEERPTLTTWQVSS